MSEAGPAFPVLNEERNKTANVELRPPAVRPWWPVAIGVVLAAVILYFGLSSKTEVPMVAVVEEPWDPELEPAEPEPEADVVEVTRVEAAPKAPAVVEEKREAAPKPEPRKPPKARASVKRSKPEELRIELAVAPSPPPEAVVEEVVEEPKVETPVVLAAVEDACPRTRTGADPGGEARAGTHPSADRGQVRQVSSGVAGVRFDPGRQRSRRGSRLREGRDPEAGGAVHPTPALRDLEG